MTPKERLNARIDATKTTLTETAARIKQQWAELDKLKAFAATRNAKKDGPRYFGLLAEIAGHEARIAEHEEANVKLFAQVAEFEAARDAVEHDDLAEMVTKLSKEEIIAKLLGEGSPHLSQDLIETWLKKEAEGSKEAAAYRETVHLLRDPTNAEHLMRGLESFRTFRALDAAKRPSRETIEQRFAEHDARIIGSKDDSKDEQG